MSGATTAPGGEHITDPREIRKQLLELALTGSMPGRRGIISACSALVHNCMRTAQAQGLSGEDTYTLIAWHLLHQAMRLEKIVLDDAYSRPAPQLVADHATITPPPVATGNPPRNY